MKTLAMIFLYLLSINLTAQQEQKASCGKIIHIENFPSKLIEPRNVDIWFPDNQTDGKRYSVLYMHDGQMLFDPTSTWNKQSWNVDDVACMLIGEGKLQDFIIVGIWNVPARRHADYFPQKPFESLSQAQKDTITIQLQNAGRTVDTFQPNSDSYLKFLVTELKPYIDEQYPVSPDKDNTYMAGSSMGGLISIYAICEYPDVYGGIACLSTHWPGTFEADNPFPQSFRSYLERTLPDPADHKIYFDYGDKTLDSLYEPFQKKIDEIMIRRGYGDENWETLYFKDKDHSESSWHDRFEIPLLFLLGK